MKKLESLNNGKFPTLTPDQKMSVKGGGATEGGTVTYQGKDYRCDTDKVEWVDGRYHFLGYYDGKLVLDYWG